MLIALDTMAMNNPRLGINYSNTMPVISKSIFIALNSC